MEILAIPGLALSIVSFVIILRRRKEPVQHSLISSYLVFLPFYLLSIFAFIAGYNIVFHPETIGGGGSGMAVSAIFYFLIVGAAALAGLLASYFRGFKTLFLIILFVLGSIAMYFPTGFYLYQGIKGSLQRGSIGGISADEALACAKGSLDSRIKYDIGEIKKGDNFFDNFAAWEVKATTYDKNQVNILQKYIYVNATNCSIEYLGDEKSENFTISLNGQPLANVEVFSERQDEYGDSVNPNRITRYGDIEDYGLTDQSGKVKLIVDSTSDNKIYVRDGNGKITYLDYPKGTSSLSLDFANAKPAPKYSILCKILYNISGNVNYSSAETCPGGFNK